MAKKTPAVRLCPCGSEQSFDACCGRFLLPAASEYPQTPEALMRSRYTAFATGNVVWVRKTWAPETCPVDLESTWNTRIKWLGLTVKKSIVTDATNATVEFVARGKDGGGPAFRLHELSRFEKRQGRWVYVDGDLKESE